MNAPDPNFAARAHKMNILSHVATMLQTLMALPGRPDSPE